MVEVCKGHIIDHALEINCLVPLDLLIGMMVNEHIRHVILDQCLDLFWNVKRKALFVCMQKWCCLFFVQVKTTGLVELMTKPSNWRLDLANFDGQTVWFGQVWRCFFEGRHFLDHWSQTEGRLFTSALDVSHLCTSGLGGDWKPVLMLCCKFARVSSQEEDSQANKWLNQKSTK